MEILMRKSYKNRTCTKSTQVYWARFTAQAITHCQHTSVGCFLRVPFTPSANGTLIFPLGYLPSQPLQACCAKSQLQSRAQTGWTQSYLPGSSDGSEPGTGSNLGTGSKTQDLSKSNWKRPFFLPLKGEQVCWHVTMGRGPCVCTEDEVDNGKGGAENPPETPSLVTTSSCVSPYLDFQSWEFPDSLDPCGHFPALANPEFYPINSQSHCPERNTVDILGLISPTRFNASTYIPLPLFSYFDKTENTLLKYFSW